MTATEITKKNDHLYELVRRSDSVMHYIDQVCKVVQNQYHLKNIDIKAYERIINYMTIAKLEADEMKKTSIERANKNLNDYLEKKDLQPRMFNAVV